QVVRSVRVGRYPARSDLFAGAAAHGKAICLCAARSSGETLPRELFAVAAGLAAPNPRATVAAGAGCALRVRVRKTGHRPLLRHRQRTDLGDASAAAGAIPVAARRGGALGSA